MSTTIRRAITPSTISVGHLDEGNANFSYSDYRNAMLESGIAFVFETSTGFFVPITIIKIYRNSSEH